MQNDLADEDPDEKMLRRHPIHYQGWFDEDGYWNTNNYPHAFIRARNCPPAMWPINASDWGFEEWLPSQTDMTPGGYPHPEIVIVNGQEQVGLSLPGVNAAFYYR